MLVACDLDLLLSMSNIYKEIFLFRVSTNSKMKRLMLEESMCLRDPIRMGFLVLSIKRMWHASFFFFCVCWIKIYYKTL
jgi:hypothetical protein